MLYQCCYSEVWVHFDFLLFVCELLFFFFLGMFIPEVFIPEVLECHHYVPLGWIFSHLLCWALKVPFQSRNPCSSWITPFTISSPSAFWISLLRTAAIQMLTLLEQGSQSLVQTHCICITWGLVGNMPSGGHPGPSESETLREGPSNLCVNRPSGWFRCT